MAEMGVTEVAAVQQALIASIVQDTLKQNSVLLGAVANYSSLAAPGNKSVSISRRTQFAAADKAENTDLTAQEMTFSVDTIDLTKHKAIYAKLERIAGIQAMPNVKAEIIKEMALELALQIDKDIYAQLILASASSPDHRIAFANSGTDDTLGKTDVLEARRLLNVQNVPMNDRFLLVNPTHEKELLLIDDFVSADKYGSAQAVQLGELGRIFGMPVLMSNVVTAKKVVAFHRSAVAFAQQLSPEFETDKDLKSVSDEFLMHVLYGAKVLDSGKRQVVLGTAT